MLKHLVIIFMLSTLPFMGSAKDAIKKGEVMVSIAPLHGIVSAVMEGMGTPVLMVPATASEHGFSLKPSQRSILGQAKILIQIDKHYETFLSRAMEGSRTRLVSVTDMAGVKVLPLRTPHHHEHSSDEEGVIDGHLWLSPENAKAIAMGVAKILGENYPEHQIQFQANSQAFITKLKKKQTQWQAALAPVQSKPFIVFHDAYHYLEQSFGLTFGGAITLSGEHGGSVKHIAELRERIRKENITCIFREPQYNSRLTDTLAEDLPLNQGVLDPLGKSCPLNSNHYFCLMDGLVKGLVECLK